MINVSAEELVREEWRRDFAMRLSVADYFPTADEWDYATTRSLPGLAPALLERYLMSCTADDLDREECHDTALEAFPRYLMAIDRHEAIDAVYPAIERQPTHIAALIRDADLFDATAISELAERGEPRAAIALLDALQPQYSAADLQAMCTLLDALRCLPEVGYIDERHGLLGTQLRYICPAGHSNDPQAEYCSHCGLNIQGINRSDVKAIEAFSRRISALRCLLQSK